MCGVSAGVAQHMIVTGGAAHNQFYEADCMRRTAIEAGVPPDAVVEERQAQDTIQNIWFSKQIMDAHGWRSAEVVSSPSHLPGRHDFERYRVGMRSRGGRMRRSGRGSSRASRLSGASRGDEGMLAADASRVPEESMAAGELMRFSGRSGCRARPRTAAEMTA